MKRGLIARLVFRFVGFALTAVCVSAQCLAPDFTVTEFTLPTFGRHVAVADFNRDGKDDVAIPDNTQIQVLLGDGNGSFNTSLPNSSATSPRFVAVGDFNRDGKADLAVGSGTATTDVTVLKGLGSGKFVLLSTVSLGTTIHSDKLTVGDVNNDGNPDIVTANFNSSYSVLLGDGAGGFTAARTQLPVSSGSIRLADINRDGSLDIVFTANLSNQIGLLSGNGDGTFGSTTLFNVGALPVDLAIGDFNRDARLDLVVANENSNSFSLLLGNSVGGFGTATSFGEAGRVHAIVAADFNGDGKLDVANTNSDVSQFNVSVRLGNGSGNFGAAVNFATSFTSFSLAVGKLSANCKPDLVTPLSSVSRLTVLSNNCP